MRRGLSRELVESVLRSPGQRIAIRPGREAFQSKVELGTPPRSFLVRVIVDVDRMPPRVVTAYRTSKISKYW